MTDQTLVDIVQDLNKIGLLASVEGYAYNEERQEFMIGMRPSRRRGTKPKSVHKDPEVRGIRNKVMPILRGHCPESLWRTGYRKDHGGLFSRMANGTILAFRWRAKPATKKRLRGK